MNYKVSLFGVKDTTKTIVEYIHNNICNVDLIVTINPEKTSIDNIAGYENLDSIADKYRIRLFKANSYELRDKKSIDFFNQNTFDIAISLGWQRIIPENILNAFKIGIFGFHGSCAYLPFGRGRSPLNWSLVLGDRRFILNMFKYDKKADSPNIFSKKMWEITEYDNIRTMQYKQLLCSKEMIKELLKAYKEDDIKIITNSEDINSWYRKRTPNDGRIYFIWRTKDIYNLIRAVTHPFHGAFCFCNNTKVIIWEAFPFDMVLDFSCYRVGEVIDVFDNNPIIRTLDGSMLMIEYEGDIVLQKGDVLE